MEIFLAVNLLAMLVVFAVDASQKRRDSLNRSK